MSVSMRPGPVLAGAAACLVAALVLAPSAGAQVSVPVVPIDGPTDVPGPTGGTEAEPVGTPAPRAQGESLVGVFVIDEGVCGGGGVTDGSHFRMVTPSGQVGTGPYAPNSSSPCDDNSYTPLGPGSDGGLSTAGYQATPDPAFSDGDATAAAIIEPTSFNGVDFSVSTNAVDPQTEVEVPVPTVTSSGGSVSGDLRALSAHWNNQHFNQGAPKPDGSSPGNTQALSGTYDPASGAFTLEWASQIEGGPFDNFTGVWHLEGTFRPSAQQGGDTTTSTSGGTAGGAPGSTTSTGGTAGGDSVAQSAGDRESVAGSGRLPRTGGPFGVMPLAALAASLSGWSALRRASRLAGRAS